jgi:hypothetical protein
MPQLRWQGDAAAAEQTTRTGFPNPEGGVGTCRCTAVLRGVVPLLEGFAGMHRHFSSSNFGLVVVFR